MATFVLVHGAWLDGTAWEQVIKHLESKGHKAYGPTVAGNGQGVNKDVNHAQCTQSIVDFIVGKDLGEVVLLGHSYGGTIIAKVAEAIPERVKRLVFWNAFVPLDGNSLVDECPPHYRELFAQLAQQSGDNTVTFPFPMFREAIMNDADLDLAKSTYEMLSSQPYQPLVDKLDLKKFYSLEIPKSFINCTEDIGLPHGEWGWHPRMTNRLGLCRLVQMPGSHGVIFTNPVGLAEKIIEAGRD